MQLLSINILIYKLWKNRNQTTQNQTEILKREIPSVRLSVSKTQKIEKGFRTTINESREGYLSKELIKYKGIKITYD